VTNKLVSDALAQLDALPPADSWVEVSGDPEGEVSIVGNALGLARLARILLRCALDTPEAREYRSAGPAAKELRDLSSTGSDLSLTSVELLSERTVPVARRKRVPDRLALLGCGLVVFLVGFIFLMGLSVVAGFIRVAR